MHLQVFGSLQSRPLKAPRWAWRVFQPSKWLCKPPTPQFNGENEFECMPRMQMPRSR